MLNGFIEHLHQVQMLYSSGSFVNHKAVNYSTGGFVNAHSFTKNRSKYTISRNSKMFSETGMRNSGLKFKFKGSNSSRDTNTAIPNIRTYCIASSNKDPVREWILSEGGASEITRVSAVGGGCINAANHYQTDAGSFFVKTNRSTGPQMFEAEARGLQAMHETSTIRVPKPFKVGALPGRGSFIIMEHVEMGSLKGGQAELGRQLAAMHQVGTTEKGFGFHLDNTIGSTPQHNPWTQDWITFYRDQRLGYQFSLIRSQYGDQDLFAKGQKLMARLPELLEGVQVRPSLIHGDLWSGNICADKGGNPVILDPATYYGHNEAEFGMSWCASFGPAFYKAYFEVMPKQSGFEQRAPLYKLYHYLNHYNLFGSGYRSSCTSIIDSYV